MEVDGELNNEYIINDNNMNYKTFKLTESDLHNIIKKSVARMLKENEDSYYGGGLPSHYFDDDKPENDRISQEQLASLDKISEAIADIANNTSDEADLLYQAVQCIDEFVAKYKSE